ncbi:lipopolysaccharide biosynthesis protein [Cellulomonas xylanilytica]|uniref:Lipopolysaccharide biosynthesis protein n=1 Tax=Cellulomonas xylanilytica TaxID=233583 RepID=A0A510V3M6_9CELL|nr:lipopolysaccharide biosynthesis protein [Cellulomonas xylanilytica]
MSEPLVAGDSLGRSAATGTSWTVLGQGVRTIVLLVSTVVLARLLDPDDFGVMAVVTSVVAFGELVYGLGLTTAAAREANLSRAQRSNLFWVNTALGVVMAAVAYGLAGPLSDLFDMPTLQPALMVVSGTFVVNGLAAQFRAEINRTLRFRALMIVDTVPTVLGFTAALAVATTQRTIWVLVAQYLVIALTGCLLAVVLARWLPGLPSRAAKIGDLLRYGIGLFGTQIVAYFTRNVDNYAIGYVWGAAPLGVYSRAYQLLMAPMSQISAPLTRVYVPILSRVASDLGRHLRYVRLVATIPEVLLGSLYAIAAGAASPLILILFGERWMEMVPVFQALAIGGVFRALNQVTFWVFLSLGASTQQFRFYLWSQPLVAVIMLAGLPWGIVGVAVGHSVGYALNWLLSLSQVRRSTGFDSGALLRDGLWSVAIFATPLGALAFGASILLVSPWSALLVTAGVCAGYIAVVVLTLPFGKRVLGDARRAVAEVRGRSA